MITILQQTNRESKPRLIESFRAGTLVYVEHPEESDISRLVESLSLEQGLLLDALDPNEAPRFEMEGRCAYVFTRIPACQDDPEITIPVLFVVTQSAVVILVKKRLPVFTAILDGTKPFTTTNRIRLFIRLLDLVVTSYTSLVVRENRRVMAAGTKVNGITNQDIVSLVNSEYVLNECVNALVQTNAFLKGLVSHRMLFAKTEDRELVEDVFLATGQIITLSKSGLTNAKNIRDAYSTIMTNNLNSVIKFFTTLTIILTIPTILSSFYGMNIRLPMQDHPQAFVFVVALTVFTCIGLFYYFFRRRWL